MAKKRRATTKTADGIKVKCAYTDIIDTAKVKPNPANPNTHSEGQVATLANLIKHHGWRHPITISKRSNMVVMGHARLMAAQHLGVKKVPVDFQHFKDWAEEHAVLIADNVIAELAETDEDLMRSLLVELDQLDYDLDLTAFDSDELNEYLHPDGEDLQEEIDPIPDPPKKPITKKGDLWLLGRHRVLCGDATKPEDVAQLMDGKKADMGLTSPPYAVGKEYEKDTSFEGHLGLLEGVADRGLDAIKAGGFFFINFGEIAAQSHAGPLTGCKRQCLYLISADYWRIFRERKYELYAQRVWYKPFNRLQQPFWTYKTSIPHYQEWEPIWTWRLPGGKGDAVHDWDISVRAVWDTRNESTDDKPLTRHVAAFPVGIPGRALKAHSGVGALVWEPFCGSGTTLIAAEQLDRICYGLEIEPAYCDVIVERWQNLTGEKAKREKKARKK